MGTPKLVIVLAVLPLCGCYSMSEQAAMVEAAEAEVVTTDEGNRWLLAKRKSARLHEMTATDRPNPRREPEYESAFANSLPNGDVRSPLFANQEPFLPDPDPDAQRIAVNVEGWIRFFQAWQATEIFEISRSLRYARLDDEEMDAFIRTQGYPNPETLSPAPPPTSQRDDE